MTNLDLDKEVGIEQVEELYFRTIDDHIEGLCALVDELESQHRVKSIIEAMKLAKDLLNELRATSRGGVVRVRDVQMLLDPATNLDNRRRRVQTRYQRILKNFL